jgi:hypothetical protein
MRHVLVDKATSVFTANTSRERRILVVHSSLDTISSSALMCVQELMVTLWQALHVLLLLHTGNHCRDFLLRVLLKLLENVPVPERAKMW